MLKLLSFVLTYFFFARPDMTAMADRELETVSFLPSFSFAVDWALKKNNPIAYFSFVAVLHSANAVAQHYHRLKILIQFRVTYKTVRCVHARLKIIIMAKSNLDAMCGT